MSDIFPATSMPDRDWWAALWTDPERTLRQVGIGQDMTVLDLCCGDGYFTAPLAGIVSGKVIALDLDPEMIERAKAEVAAQGLSIRQWICADALDIASLIADGVDFVLMANTFHGVPDQGGLIRAIRPVLKPGGLFCIINWHAIPREGTVVLDLPRGPRTEMRMSPEQTRGVFEAEGFLLKAKIELPPYHYAEVFIPH